MFLLKYKLNPRGVWPRQADARVRSAIQNNEPLDYAHLLTIEAWDMLTEKLTQSPVAGRREKNKDCKQLASWEIAWNGACDHLHYGMARSVVRLSLGRRSVNLLPVAQRTNALTNGVVDRPWVGREFESHVHENTPQRKVSFLMSRI